MIILGLFGLVAVIVVALVVAGVTVYSGWHAFHDEFATRSFRSQPPGAAAWGLTLLGVLLPVGLIVLFLLVFAAWLFGLLLR